MGGARGYTGTEHISVKSSLILLSKTDFNSKVTVHISDSEDEDEEEFVSDDEANEGGDAEGGARTVLAADTGPPTSCIIPIYR